MSRYIGNYLRVPSLEPQQASAPGIWSINEQLAYQRANVWPPARDPYYNQTVLHLSGDVAATRETNPVTQPRTFLSDASTNNFLLTPNGDVSARPFSPYLENYSGYAPGNCYVDIASNSGFNLSDNANFTIEFWINCPATSGALWIASGWQNTSNLSWSLSWRSNNAIEFYGRQSSGGAGTIYYVNNSGDNTVLSNTWTHYAVVRNSSTISVYVNGNLINTGTINGTPAPSTNCRFFGDSLNGSQLTGYISNFRFSRSAVYTQPFTPATQPLTITSQGASNVVFLGFNKNRFVDVANNLAFTFTSGNPAISANSPFVSLDTTSGSGYFDGTGDYLNGPTNTAAVFNLTGDFTIECWAYFTSASTAGQGLVTWADSGGWNGWQFINDAGTIKFEFLAASSAAATVTGGTVVNNQWYHLAVVRNGSGSNNVVIYINGSSSGSPTTYTGTQGTSASSFFRIGVDRTATNEVVGYLSGARVVNGTALYTSSFSIPTAPPTLVAGTSLLTLQTRHQAQNSGFLDSSPNNFVVTRSGNATQGSFSPFSPSGWSVAVNGGSGYISYANNSNWNLGADFCVEAFIYLSSGTGTNRTIVSRHAYGVDAQWEFVISSNNKVTFVFWNQAVSLAQSLESDGTLSLGQWYHVAGGIVGSSIFVCLDGVYKSTALTVTPGTSYSKAIHIGTNLTTNQYQMTGYISDVRIVRGSPVYTANYTVPTGPLTAITNTQLLTCQGRNFKDYSNNNLTASINGTASIQPFYRLQPTQAYVASQLGGSAYFDGSSDYLSFAVNQTPLALGNSDFTVEAWVYRLNTNTACILGGQSDLNTAAGSAYVFYVSSSAGSDLYSGSSGYGVTSPNPGINQWAHVAWVRTGGTYSSYLNGVRIGNRTDLGTATVNTGSTNYAPAVGGFTNSTSVLTGYISSLRFIKGSGGYNANDTNIVIPTAPPVATQNTSLLLNFTGAGIVDSTGRNNPETVANSGVQTTVIKYGNGSMYFDGNLDQFVFPSSPLYAFGTGDFTIELWAYSLDSGASLRGIIDTRPPSAGLNGLMLRENSGGFLLLSSTSGNIIITTTGRTANVWQHIALVRASGTFSLYVNGLFQTSATPATNDFSSGNIRLSGFIDTAASPYAYFGYMSNIRVTRTARYSGTNTSTPNFTLPPGPFPLA